MAHAELAELANWLTSIITEGKREADYKIDARDILSMIGGAPSTVPTAELAAPPLAYSFTAPATFVRFTVRARDELAADIAARSLGEEVHKIDGLAALGVEVTEISFADGSEIERDDTEESAVPAVSCLLADDS